MEIMRPLLDKRWQFSVVSVRDEKRSDWRGRLRNPGMRMARKVARYTVNENLAGRSKAQDADVRHRNAAGLR